MHSFYQKSAPERLEPQLASTDSEAAKLAQNFFESVTDGNASGSQAFASFFKNSPDPILLFSSSGEVVAKNDRALILWNGSADFLPPLLLDEVTRLGEDGVSFKHTGKDEIIEIQTIGELRFFLPTVFNLLPRSKSNNEQGPLIACILKDQTDWAHSENIRNNLLSSIHHELNTPLTSARVALYLLAEQQIGALNEVQAELVDRAKEDLDREISTIQNVLALMRSDCIGSDNTSDQAINLHELIDEIMLEMHELKDALHLTINRYYSDEAPRIPMERETICLIIKHVFCSILKNVEKEAAIDVVTSVEDKYNLLKLTSSDPALVDALPNNLFSLPIESKDMRRVQCVDLGLRMAHEIVQEHGGEISATQTPEIAVITLRLPKANHEASGTKQVFNRQN